MKERIMTDSTAQHSTAQHSTAQHSTAKVVSFFHAIFKRKRIYKDVW